MSFNEIKLARCFIKNRLGFKTPFECGLLVTYRCNLNCKMCCVPKKSINPELSTTQLKSVIREISETGVCHCGISGGEPLLRNDLEIIGKEIHTSVMTSSLNSNGTLITKKKAATLVDCFDVFNISIDGSETVHNQLRGDKHSFKKAVTGLENLICEKKESKVGIAFTLSKQNAESLPEVIRLAEEINADYLTVQPVNFKKSDLPSSLQMKRAITELVAKKRENPKFVRASYWFLNNMAEYARDRKFECDPGKLYFFIEPDGTVIACPNFSSKLGNITQTPLKNLLSTVPEKLPDNCPGCFMKCSTEISHTLNRSLINLPFDTLKYLRSNYFE